MKVPALPVLALHLFCPVARVHCPTIGTRSKPDWNPVGTGWVSDSGENPCGTPMATTQAPCLRRCDAT